MNSGINKEELLLKIESLDMYKEETIKLFSKLTDLFDKISNCYKDANYTILSEKINNLCFDLDTSIKNKEECIQSLNSVIVAYDKQQQLMGEKITAINTNITS